MINKFKSQNFTKNIIEMSRDVAEENISDLEMKGKFVLQNKQIKSIKML